MLPEFKTLFVVSTRSVGLCHPTSDMFSICDLLNCRVYKVKENLTPFHKREFVIPVASFFSPTPGHPPCNFHQLFCHSQHQQPSQQQGQRDSVVRLSLALPTAHTLQAPWRQVGCGELVLSWAVWGSGSTPGRAAGGRDSVPSVGTARLAGVCQRAQG